MDVCVCPVFVLSCVSSGLATGWSLVQGVLPIVYKCKITEPHKRRPRLYMGCSAIGRRRRGNNRTKGYYCHQYALHTFSNLLIYQPRIWEWFDVLTAEVMKRSIFWDIMPCSPLKVNRIFGGTCRFHHQGRKMSQVRNQRDCLLDTCFTLVPCLAYFRPWRWKWHLPPKRRLTFSALHGVISHKIELFMRMMVVRNILICGEEDCHTFSYQV
jgi:hypothetical protein